MYDRHYATFRGTLGVTELKIMVSYNSRNTSSESVGCHLGSSQDSPLSLTLLCLTLILVLARRRMLAAHGERR